MEPIAAERCIAPIELTEPRLSRDGESICYASSAAGIARLVVHYFDGRPDTELATSPALRPGRGLGGGGWCWTAAMDAVVYVGADGNLWHQLLDSGSATRITEHGPERIASAPHAMPDGLHVVYVVDQAEVRIVAIAGGQPRRLDGGVADFCFDPWSGPGGRSVQWQAWDVPDMPWDASRIARASLDGAPLSAIVPAHSVQQPRVLPDGRGVCIRDDHGWANLWVGDSPLVEEPFEHAGPTWGEGQRSYAWSPDGGRIAFTRNEAGFGRLCVVDTSTGTVTEVARAVHGQLSWEGHRIAALRTGARAPTQVVVYDTDTWERTVVAVGPRTDWSDDELVEPLLVEVAVAEDGLAGGPAAATVHARFYPAESSAGRLIVWLHGGPTDQWPVTFMPRLNYWRSRGWNVLVPDHRGSTGHGRAYQQALRGRWGELDVADAVAVTRHAEEHGWGQPVHTVLMGSSAGGFTALGALGCEPELFAAAVVLYPVTDLVELAERSHRFERHYSHSLVGPLPESLDIYRARSPIWHADRFTSTPILMLHGDLDPVVPVGHSRVFAERVRAAGGCVELHVYPGEGHGFRDRDHQLDEYRRIEAFLDAHLPIGSRP